MRKSNIGNIYEILNHYAINRKRELSFENNTNTLFPVWKEKARSKFLELLNYNPVECDFDAVIESRKVQPDYIREEIKFNTSVGVRIEATMLIPNINKTSYPTIIALHDHSGFYYYGKDKIIPNENEAKELTDIKFQMYDGFSYTIELVKRGYIVFCIDAFYFGSRKIDISSISEDVLQDTNPAPYDYKNEILSYNETCGKMEWVVFKHILMSGTTWAGMMLFDDRRCVDYLMTRKEVDKEKIGCMGISLGGFRSACLAASDDRIKAAVVAGWMTTYDELIFSHSTNHTFMLHVPNLAGYMDLPDLVSLAAPNALFVQQCLQDSLYTTKGMTDACEKIANIYEYANAQQKYKYQFYDNTHKLTLTMQQDAYDWLDVNLKSAGGESVEK